jgi:hypothetical protein
MGKFYQEIVGEGWPAIAVPRLPAGTLELCNCDCIFSKKKPPEDFSSGGLQKHQANGF